MHVAFFVVYVAALITLLENIPEGGVQPVAGAAHAHSTCECGHVLLSRLCQVAESCESGLAIQFRSGMWYSRIVRPT